MYSYYEIIRCVKRIALPSPKKHAFLIPAIVLFPSFFCFILFLLFPLIRSFLFLLRATHVGTARIQTQWDPSRTVVLGPRFSRIVSRAHLNRGNRSSLFVRPRSSTVHVAAVIATWPTVHATVSPMVETRAPPAESLVLRLGTKTKALTRS